MNTHDDDPKKLSFSVERLLKTLKAPNPDVLATVFLHWSEVVGADVAAHSKPSFIEGNTLVVATTDTVWASQLMWLEAELVAKIQKVSKSDRIQTLKVRVKTQG